MPEGRSPLEIRQDIAVTRAEMNQAIGTLEQRLSPGELFEQAWSRVKDGGPAAVGDVVRSHAVPLALLGAGAVWLAIDMARRTGTDDRRTVRSVVEQRPLAAGAIAFGVGLAAALAAPGTYWENRLRQRRYDAALP